MFRKILMTVLLMAVLFIGSTEKVESRQLLEYEDFYYEVPENLDRGTVQELNEEDQKPSPTKILLSFAGDCTIGTDESFWGGNTLPEVLKRQNYDYAYFFSAVSQLFKEDDVTLVNLETALTRAVDKAEKTYRFKGEPEYVNILQSGSVEMVNISNNHIYDYLQKGFDETLQTLDNSGILYSGEGHFAYTKVKGKTIASIGYKGWDTTIKKNLKEDIENARKNADLVLVSFHWGSENAYYPDTVQKELARYSIDWGADVVIGHHPHVIQGVELYKGRYIVYSLGNFCFGGNSNPIDKDTFVFQNEFTFEGDALLQSNGTVIPCNISSEKNVNDYKPVMLEGSEKQRVMERIYEYSKPLEFGIKP